MQGMSIPISLRCLKMSLFAQEVLSGMGGGGAAFGTKFEMSKCV